MGLRQVRTRAKRSPVQRYDGIHAKSAQMEKTNEYAAVFQNYSVFTADADGDDDSTRRLPLPGVARSSFGLQATVESPCLAR
jgi:hypothetical protein